MLDAAASRGYLFQYKYDQQKPHQKDHESLKDWYTLLLQHIQDEPTGGFLEVPVRNALEELEAFTGRNFHDILPLKLQANNYCRYFKDIRATKRNMSTGSRLPHHLRQLASALQIDNTAVVHELCDAPATGTPLQNPTKLRTSVSFSSPRSVQSSDNECSDIPRRVLLRAPTTPSPSKPKKDLSIPTIVQPDPDTQWSFLVLGRVDVSNKSLQRIDAYNLGFSVRIWNQDV